MVTVVGWATDTPLLYKVQLTFPPGFSTPRLFSCPDSLSFREVRIRNCLKILSTSQPPYHQPCHRRIDERFSGGAQPLVILAHPPVLREPGEGPLHYPSAG